MEEQYRVFSDLVEVQLYLCTFYTDPYYSDQDALEWRYPPCHFVRAHIAVIDRVWSVEKAKPNVRVFLNGLDPGIERQRFRKL